MSDSFDALSAELYEITRLIAGIESKGSFATCFTASAGGLQLMVDGAGHVSLPVLAATARKLRKVAQPAHYGLKDQTLLDPAVRDTWEIPGSRVSIDPRRWEPALKKALDQDAAMRSIVPSYFAEVGRSRMEQKSSSASLR